MIKECDHNELEAQIRQIIENQSQLDQKLNKQVAKSADLVAKDHQLSKRLDEQDRVARVIIEEVKKSNVIIEEFVKAYEHIE
jgi:hypothetical protein